MATINDFSFGSIVIDNKKYRRDVFIYPDGRVKPRKGGILGDQSIKRNEIERLIEYNTVIIIIGTGTDDYTRLAAEAKNLVKEGKINLAILPSHQTVNDYNELTGQGKKVAKLIHITC